MRALISISVLAAACLISGHSVAASELANSRAEPVRIDSTRPTPIRLDAKRPQPVRIDPIRTRQTGSTTTDRSTEDAAPSVQAPTQTKQPERIDSPRPTTKPVIAITNETLEGTTDTQTTEVRATPKRITTPRTESPSVITTRTLSWSIPAKRTDGSSFFRRELGGYYLTVKNVLTGGVNQIHIGDPDTTSYALRTFRAGQYAFSIQSYDLDGLVSPQSPWVNVTI